MAVKDLVEEVLDHPQAIEMMERIQTELKKEREARKVFREWLTDDRKAEFINGEIVMHSPVKRGHLNAVGNLYHLLDAFVVMQDLGVVSSEKALIGMNRNDYEPDVVFWNKETAKSFTKDTMVHPIPQLVVEVLSKSTKSKDRGVKFTDYAAHQIPEYWIIDYEKKKVEQYTLPSVNSTGYQLLQTKEGSDNIESQVIIGFKIPVAAIFEKKIYIQTLTTLLTS